MTARLTDAQVAALTQCESGSYNEQQLSYPHPCPCGRCSSNKTILSENEVIALALEVQQSRQRRCDGCVHFVAGTAYVTGLDTETKRYRCDRLSTDGGMLTVLPTWHCADFTPK